MALVGLALTCLLTACSPPAPPNVVMISVDTLRADRLNAYGYTTRTTSPHMDALAGDGVLFEVHLAASPWTTPSHLSLLTGLTPTRHGVVKPYRAVVGSLDGEGELQRLPEEIPTLATLAEERGWVTAAFTGGATLDPRIGFDRGFGEYDTSMAKLSHRKIDRLLEWVDARDEGPFFLFWHTFEVHAPYLEGEFLAEVLPEDQADDLSSRLARLARRPGDWKPVQLAIRALEKQGAFRRDVVSALYDGGVRSFDRWLGELLDGLRERGLYDRTLIILTSDHGEQLGEPGRPTTSWGDTFYNVHGNTVHEELIRVPLIIKLPDQEYGGLRIEAVTASIDVAPTVLDVLDLAPSAVAQGRSLRPLWEGRRLEPRAALSEALASAAEMKSLRGERYKYVVTINGPTVAREGRSPLPPRPSAALYDLLRDPGEQHDLLHARADAAVSRQAEDMLRELRGRVAAPGQPASSPLSAETLEGLRALGYVE